MIRLVAIHNRALTPEQIAQNYQAGVGERFFVMFGVSDLVDVPASYIVFEATPTSKPKSVLHQPRPERSVGRHPGRGDQDRHQRRGSAGRQSFAHVDTTIRANAYDSEKGQPLAQLGGVVPLEKGPDSDEFFLTFDRLGTHTDAAGPATGSRHRRAHLR